MELFGVLGVILVMAVLAKRPGRAAYGVIALAAVAASIYEYLK
ncbi:MAG TPA: hypothetical protein VKE27_09055 [Candidatus Dormibacteraeota bacterium]|nr:hypothetical protein [Candidatus Dormibacteraeota bacterium]